MRACLAGFAVLFTLQLTLAQDFQKKYDLSAGGQILIRNYLGNVKVEGYPGTSIEVKAYKKGPDRDLIQISDLSVDNRIEVLSRFPPFYNGTSTVDFEVRVPSSVEYNFTRLSSFGGNVEVSHVIGRLRAESVRGNVDVKDVLGLVSASSISGNVSARNQSGSGPEQHDIQVHQRQR